MKKKWVVVYHQVDDPNRTEVFGPWRNEDDARWWAEDKATLDDWYGLFEIVQIQIPPPVIKKP